MHAYNKLVKSNAKKYIDDQAKDKDKQTKKRIRKKQKVNSDEEEEEEEIYMIQPIGFSDGSDKVCRLKSSLYGLKQSSRVWNETFTKSIQDLGLKRSEYDHCLFYGEATYLIMYVDDILIAAKSNDELKVIKEVLMKNFNMVDLGDVVSFLGIQIRRDRIQKKLYISQSPFIAKLLLKYKMTDCNPVSIPLDPSFKFEINNKDPIEFSENFISLIGSLIYLSTVSRSDICYAIGILSKYLPLFKILIKFTSWQRKRFYDI